MLMLVPVSVSNLSCVLLKLSFVEEENNRFMERKKRKKEKKEYEVMIVCATVFRSKRNDRHMVSYVQKFLMAYYTMIM